MTVLWLVGLEFALSIELLAGILIFVSYLGIIVGLTLAAFVAVIQFQEWNGVFAVWAVFAIGQMVEGMAISSWLVGDRIGLHPVLAIFSILAFAQLFSLFEFSAGVISRCRVAGMDTAHSPTIFRK